MHTWFTLYLLQEAGLWCKRKTCSSSSLLDVLMLIPKRSKPASSPTVLDGCVSHWLGIRPANIGFVVVCLWKNHEIGWFVVPWNWWNHGYVELLDVVSQNIPKCSLWFPMRSPFYFHWLAFFQVNHHYPHSAPWFPCCSHLIPIHMIFPYIPINAALSKHGLQLS